MTFQLDQNWHEKARKEVQQKNRRPFYIYYTKNGKRYYHGSSTQVMIAKAGAIHGMKHDPEITSFLLSSKQLECVNYNFK